MLLEGLFLPLTTPFYPDGRLYLRKLEHNAERYSRTLAAGLALLTPTGEAERLSDEECGLALKSAAEATARETVLLADVSRGSVRGALALAETAASLQYDVALLRLPAHAGGATEAEQRTLVQAVADRSPLPIVLLEETTETLGVDFLAEMAQHPGVIGWVAAASGVAGIERVLARTAAVKREVMVTSIFAAVTGRMLARRPAASSGSYIAAESLRGGGMTALATAPPEVGIKTRSRTVGFQVLAGRTQDGLSALRSGARGTMLPFGVCSPQACHEMFAAWKDDDQGLAEEKYDRIARAAATVEETLGIAGLKSGADLNGYFGGAPRLPGLPLRGAELNVVQQLMRSMRS